MIQAFRFIEISKYDDGGQLTTRGQLMQGSSSLRGEFSSGNGGELFQGANNLDTILHMLIGESKQNNYRDFIVYIYLFYVSCLFTGIPVSSEDMFSIKVAFV